VDNLKAEARFLKESPLFSQLLKDMKYSANYQMYNNSSKDDDIIFGKAVLWAVDIIEKKVDNILKLK
jgi:hypothetical protein